MLQGPEIWMRQACGVLLVAILGYFICSAPKRCVADEVVPAANSPESTSINQATATASSTPVPPKQYTAEPLSPIEQLVLVLSNATDTHGQRQESLVFLGRTKNRGWEAVGITDKEELRLHWRSVADRLLQPYTQAGLSAEQLEKIDLAVELSIVQFQRLYSQLRNDFLHQPDQASRIAVLASDDRYERLRQLGRDGPFASDSLVARVINTVLARQ
ncbi:MAG: hypothetical protein KF752_14850 [Pirellulaceae bacterium]|nr:hypothetical protein [Pirellulaceae bacterium]